MPMNRVMMVGLRPGGTAEWVATMKALGTEEPRTYAGEQIRESFGMPRIYGRYLQDSDLRPELASQHRGHARYVLERLTAGRAGTFTVDAQGHFEDFHGGHGFRNPADLNWFTPAALRRGVGWYFEQTYRHGREVVGRFRVIRVIRDGDRLLVHKEPLGT